MNYLKIILDGYYGKINLNYLDDYFYRKFKKAERNHYEASEFFNGCTKVINDFEDYIREGYNKRETYLLKMIDLAERGVLKYDDSTTPIEELKKETIKKSKKELFVMEESHFTAHLYTVTGKIKSGEMRIDEIRFIKAAISQAQQKAESEEKKSSVVNQENPGETSPYKTLIINSFSAMDKQGWEYAFSSQDDFNTFVTILTNFFEDKEYSLPKSVIILKRTCRTKLAKTLGGIHKELSENPLKSDRKFLKILRILNYFKKETDLYKALTR